MVNPILYWTGARPGTIDADILDRITEQFGSHLEELTNDDKAAVLICLVEKATDTQQVVIQDNFFSHENGGDCWQLAQQLTTGSQLALALAVLNQLIYGGR